MLLLNLPMSYYPLNPLSLFNLLTNRWLNFEFSEHSLLEYVLWLTRKRFQIPFWRDSNLLNSIIWLFLQQLLGLIWQFSKHFQILGKLQLVILCKRTKHNWKFCPEEVLLCKHAWHLLFRNGDFLIKLSRHNILTYIRELLWALLLNISEQQLILC